jgi:hypothetical protein
MADLRLVAMALARIREATITLNRQRSCSTSISIIISRYYIWAGLSSTVPNAITLVATQLPHQPNPHSRVRSSRLASSTAGSFLGGFRTPAQMRAAVSLMAGIRNPAQRTNPLRGRPLWTVSE